MDGLTSPDADAPEIYADFDVASAVMAKLEKAGLLEADDGYYPPFSTEDDVWQTRTGHDEGFGWVFSEDHGHRAHYETELLELTGPANVLRRGLARMLAAREQRGWDAGKDQGRLDPRRMPAAVAGRTNVFRVREDRSELNTAVTILIDLSGSMRGRRVYEAQRCVIAFVEALERTTIRYEVLGFHSIKDNAGWYDLPVTERGRYLRSCGLNMWEFKGFEDRLHVAKPALGAIKNLVGGANPDGDCLRAAWLRRLRGRPERRKVMFVLSDGIPDIGAGPESQARLEQDLHQAVAMLRDAGIECVGLGIISDAVARFYPKHVVVKDVSDLATTGIMLLEQVLLGRTAVLVKD